MGEPAALHILDLLEQERAALTAGRFDTLDSIATLKAAALDRLGADIPRRDHLMQIKRGLAENQALLGAAIKGVSAAQHRLTALQNVRDGLSTYDRGGQKARVSTARPGFEKKA